MNPDSWSLWRAQVAAILRLEIKKNFLAKRGLWIYLLAAAPVALMWTHAMLNLRDHRVCDLGHDSLIFATMFQFFYLRFAIFFGCVGVFLRLFRGEMMEKSLHYYLLAPVRREVLLVGKYLAGVITTSIIFCTGTALTYSRSWCMFHAWRLNSTCSRAEGWDTYWLTSAPPHSPVSHTAVCSW